MGAQKETAIEWRACSLPSSLPPTLPPSLSPSLPKSLPSLASHPRHAHSQQPEQTTSEALPLVPCAFGLWGVHEHLVDHGVGAPPEK